MDFVEEFISDNQQNNPFERFILYMTEKRNKFKKENKTLLQRITTKCCDSVYDVCIRKDFYKWVTQRWMKNEYNDSVKEWFLLRNGNTMMKIKDRDGVDHEGLSKKIFFTAIASRIFFYHIRKG